ncbi:TIGR00282 family metallophosphoesterase [Oleiharenicola sp. Vm1]|uniref:TIGR00282 family metallophosphoesterase n=1 Tax=Oleiharenicola sp. Vm1 TaxID=3398393 RepID=UPI0039F5896B
MKLLFIGDIVGRPGRDAVAALVPKLRAERGLDFVIANAENCAAGAGINGPLAKGLLEAGCDALTLGDHVWDQKGWEHEIAQFERVCRPANLPAACPGRPHLVLEKNGFRLLVFTVLGRNFMGPKVDCPFDTAEKLLAENTGRFDGALVEIHAEATSEKQAMGWFLDGRATAVLGTHTHVATADCSLLHRQTAFQCDVGMTGPHDSVLGRDTAAVIARFRDGMPRRFEVAAGDVRLSGTIVEFDAAGRASRIEWLSLSA